MIDFESLVGTKYNMLTLVSFIKRDSKRSEAYCLFQCVCGNKKEILYRSVRSGSTKSCGCGKKADHVGIKYNRLTGLCFVRIEKKCTIWKWKCECGNIFEYPAQNVLKGTKKSCGCSKIVDRKNFNGNGWVARNKLFSRYKLSAKRRNMGFYLTFKYFNILNQKNCYYCNQAPKNNVKIKSGSGDIVYNGIDRVNNSFGYSKKNCVPCCQRCNLMKSNMTKDSFLDKIKSIYTNLNLGV